MAIRAASGAGWARWLPIGMLACLLLIVGDADRALAREATIGEARRVVNEVRGILGPITRELVVEDNVFSDEVIETGGEGATRVVFLDGTELSMGPNSRVTLDRYVYDPTTGTGELVANFVSGIFEFASGLIPSAGYDLRTPFANLAIRGTTINILLGAIMQARARVGEVEASGPGWRLFINDPLECLIWTTRGAEPRRVPLAECGALIEQWTAMTAALDLETLPIPGAGPPGAIQTRLLQNITQIPEPGERIPRLFGEADPASPN